MSLLLGIFSLYSYSLLDPNLTLFNHPAWTAFRNVMVQFGYYARPQSAVVFGVLLTLMHALHVFFVKRAKHYNPILVAVIVGVITSLSYPLLSHDFFNYLFDAKILTVYHSNPYLHAPLEYPTDSWTRFMHWTHRTYPYGPSFLVFTVPVVFLSFGKFLAAYVLLKIQYALLFVGTVWVVARRNREWALFFATSPIVIVEGLINLHNDIVAVCITLIAFVLYQENKTRLSRLLFLVSGGIKYTTLPFLLWSKNVYFRALALAGIVVVMIYLIFKIDTQMQPWYFLTLIALIPVCYQYLKQYSLFFTGTLYMYIYYLWTGEWSNPLKYGVTAAALVVTILYNHWYASRQTRYS